MREPTYSGVVYVEFEYALEARPHAIEGTWHLASQDRLEHGPGWDTAADAVAWGRERSPNVWLRVHRSVHSLRYVQRDGILFRLKAPATDDYVIYAAGEAAVPRSDTLPWPGASGVRADQVVPSYGGEVWLVQRPSEQGALCGLTGVIARWEAIHAGVQEVKDLAGPLWEGGLPAAVAWARERAPYVLICHGPPDYAYSSAGTVELNSLDIPRWTPPDERQIPDIARAPTAKDSQRWVVFAHDETPRSVQLPDTIEPAGGFPP